MNPTITQNDKRIMQHHIDKISQHAQVLNKMGMDVTTILQELPSLNRSIIRDSAENIFNIDWAEEGTVELPVRCVL